MTRTFIQTNEFSKNWDILGFDDEDLRLLELSILEHPEKYPIMKGPGGLRKARISLDKKGKSGGARVCFVDFILVETVYLITVYGKKEKDNLSNAERNQIKKMIDTLKKTLEEAHNE
nr:type II toxin-antitoxin system RelE/ParE family toxin [uncultured Oribacterium sp.]